MAGKLAEALVRAGVLAADAYDIEEELGLRAEGSVNLTASIPSSGRVRFVGVSGAAGSPARNPGGGGWTFDELLPRHMPVLTPETVTGLPKNLSVFTMSYDTAEKETGLGSIKLSFSAASPGLQLRCPLPTTVGFGRKVRVGSRMHVRIKCSDWTKVSRFDINVCQNGGEVDFHKFIVANAGVSYFGMLTPGNNAAWTGKWRTLALWSDRVNTTAGNPTPWGVPDDPATRCIETDGIAFYVTTTGAVDFWIDRIYSPEWPVGFVSVIGDGAYKSFRDLCVAEFAKRGWRGGVSMFNGSGTGIYPSKADLKAISDLGWDVFMHSHKLSTSSGWAATDTPADVFASTYSQRDFLCVAGVNQKGLRWNQFLMNSGRINANNLAQILEQQGIAAGRAACSDAEFGVDPWAASVYGQQGTTKTGGIMTGWVSPRGRFNRFSTEWFLGLNTPSARDTYAGSAFHKTVSYAANFADGVNSYTHQIVQNDGTNPTIYDSGTNFFQDFLADLDAKSQDGKILVLSPTEVEELTYWRQGDVFLRWDGEWAYRHDPTKIAF